MFIQEEYYTMEEKCTCHGCGCEMDYAEYEIDKVAYCEYCASELNEILDIKDKEDVQLNLFECYNLISFLIDPDFGYTRLEDNIMRNPYQLSLEITSFKEAQEDARFQGINTNISLVVQKERQKLLKATQSLAKKLEIEFNELKAREC